MTNRAMKNIVKSFVAIAALLLAFNACQQEINPSQTSGTTHSLTFVADSPITKTTANIDKESGAVEYVWNEDDENYFHVYEIDATGTYKAAKEVVADLSEGKMTLMADFEGEAVPGAKYQALFNSEVKADQAGDDVKYDQQSDVLISEIVVLEDVEDKVLELKFKRETAFAQMTIKGLTDGPTVMGVSVAATNDKILAAEYDIKTQSFSATGSSEVILTPMADVASEQADVFFASVPVEDAALTVGAVTGDENGNFVAAYEKSFAEGKSISFSRGDIRHFNIGMNKATGVTVDLTKDETTTASDSELAWDKTFISIVAAKADSQTNTNNYYPGTSGKTYTSTRFYTGSTLTFTPKLGVSIKEIVYTATSENYATVLSDNDWTNATAFVSDKVVTIIPADGTVAVSANITATTGAESIEIIYGQPVQLTAHSIIIDHAIENGSVEAVPASDIMPGTEVSLTATPNDGYVFDAWNVTNAETDDEISVVDGKFLMPNADVTVSASFIQKSLVNDPVTIDFTTMGFANGEVVNTVSENPFTVSFTKGGSNDPKYYTSNDGSMRFYNGGSMTVTSDEGITITKIEVTASKLNVSEPVLNNKVWTGSASSVEFKASGTNEIQKLVITYTGQAALTYAVECATVLGGELTASPAKAAEGSEVALTAMPDDEYEFNNDWSVKDASQNEVSVTDGKFIMPASPVSVTGSFTKKTYAITANDAEHGSYTVSINGESATSASKGDKITLTATPDEGYICDGWTVNATIGGAAVSVSNNSFTMPGAAVTISASFSEKAVVNYDHEGTETDPYSVKDALKYIGTLGTETSENDIYVKGKISSIKEISTNFGNATYNIKDASGDSEMTVFRGKYLNNVDFTANDQLAINDEVVVKGKVKDYNGTKEFDAGNYIVSIKYLRASADKRNVSAAGETVTITVDTNVEGWTVTSDNGAFTVGEKTDNTVSVTVSENTSVTEDRTANITVSAEGVEDVVITLTQDAKSDGGQGGDNEPVVLIIDGSELTSTTTTEETTNTFGGVTITLSDGAKVQSSSGDNKFTDKAILIGKSGKYIYNSTPIPGKITKFEIYANKGASAKVSVGVKFSDSVISAYATGDNTYTGTLSTLDSIYDCSSKLTSNCKYFWYQVTNANNSQVQFRITYIPDNN